MKSATKSAYLRAHSLCCFCGGVRHATTIDHQPGRVFFENKRMPDDTLFPACRVCQKVSRKAENLMSLLIARGDFSDEEFSRWQIRCAAIARKYPEFLRGMVPSEEDARALREQTAEPPEGLDAENLIVLDPDHWGPIFNVFSKKLALAMHYRGVGRPLSPTGLVVSLLVPNGHYDAAWDNEIMSVTRAAPPYRHGTQDLSKQVSLRWAYNVEEQLFGGRLTLHQSLTIYGFTSENPSSPRLAEIAHRIERPFAWHLPEVTPPEVRRRRN